MKAPRRVVAPPRRSRARRQPWELPDGFPSSEWTPEIVALQMFAAGTADAFQQRAAWKFLVDVMCETDAQSFQPGGVEGQRASDFAEGKRWIGRQMRMIARLRPQGVDVRDEPPPMPAANREVSDAPQ